jgi:hypothetical protein
VIRQPSEPTAVCSPLLTFAEAMAYLKRGRSWLKANADRIGVIRDGGKLAFLREDLDRYIASKRVQTEPVQPAGPTPIRARPAVQHRHKTNPLTGHPWVS